MHMFKRFFLLFALLTVFVYSSLFVLTWLIEPAHLQEELAKHVLAKTNRHLHIKGPVRWRVWPYFGLSASHVTLSNPKGFSQDTMLFLEHMHSEIRWWSLLTGSLNIHNVVLENPQMHLEVRPNGEDNWSDLMGQAPQSQHMQSQTFAPNNTVALMNPKDIQIQGLAIQNASIHYTNQASHQSWQFDDVSMQAHHIQENRSFVLEGTLNVNTASWGAQIHLKSPNTFWDTYQGVVRSSALNLQGHIQHAEISTPLAVNLPLSWNYQKHQLHVPQAHGDLLGGTFHWRTSNPNHAEVMQGYFEANNLTLPWPIEQLSCPVVGKKEGWEFNDCQVRMLGGHAEGSAYWDSQREQGHLLAQGSALNLGLLTHTFWGHSVFAAHADFVLNTQLQRHQPCSPTVCLHGSLVWHTGPGYLRGFDLDFWQKSLLNKEARIALDTPEGAQTLFERAQGSWKLEGQQWIDEGSQLIGKHFEAEGKGTLHWTSKHESSMLDYRLSVHYPKFKAPLHVTLAGPLDRVKIRPDAGNILHDLIREGLKIRVPALQWVDELLPPSKSSLPHQDSQP